MLLLTLTDVLVCVLFLVFSILIIMGMTTHAITTVRLITGAIAMTTIDDCRTLAEWTDLTLKRLSCDIDVQDLRTFFDLFLCVELNSVE